MKNTKIAKRDRVILEGRIYPAISSCVNNRWKIMLGLFVYYGYQFSSDFFYGISNIKPIDMVASIILFAFISYNFINYYYNAKEQIKIEQNVDNASVKEVLRASKVEIMFDGLAVISILAALILL